MASKPGYELVAELNPPGGGAWEGAVRDITTDEFYVGHSLGTGQGKIHHFGKSDSIKKPYKDTMELDDLTHIYGFGVHSKRVWIGWDCADGNDIVKLPYCGDKTVQKSAADKLHVFTENPTQVSFSPTRTRLVLMETCGGNYRFTKRRTADILKNKDDVLGKAIVVPHGDSDKVWLQGFTLSGDGLYVLWGRPDEKAWIDRYSFGRAKQTGTLDVTGAGYLPGEPHDGREPEGMDGHTFGVKVHRDSDRLLRVYRLNNF